MNDDGPLILDIMTSRGYTPAEKILLTVIILTIAREAACKMTNVAMASACGFSIQTLRVSRARLIHVGAIVTQDVGTDGHQKLVRYYPDRQI